MEESISSVTEDQPQHVAIQHDQTDGTSEVVSQEIVATGGVDVDKTLYVRNSFYSRYDFLVISLF